MQQRTFSQYPVTSSIAPYEFVWSDGSVDASDLDEYLSDSPIGYKNLGLMQMQRRHAHHRRHQNYPVRHQGVHMRPHSFYQKQFTQWKILTRTSNHIAKETTLSRTINTTPLMRCNGSPTPRHSTPTTSTNLSHLPSTIWKTAEQVSLLKLLQRRRYELISNNI